MKNFWKNKKVVVTGAAGFIGSHTVKTLIAEGALVTAVVSPATDKKKLQHSLGNMVNKITIIKANLLNFDDCLYITKGQQIVLNFAALDGGSTFKQKYPAQILKNNTEIVLHVLEASVIQKVDKVLLMSSIEVYPTTVKSPIKEKYTLGENFPEDINGYAWSKRFAEVVAKMYAKEYGLKIAIVRPGNIYGEGDYSDEERGRVIPTFIHNILDNKPVTLSGDGSQKKSFLYIGDFIKAALEVTEKYTECDPINLASEQYVSIKNLALLIGKMLKKQVTFTIRQTDKKIKNRVIDVTKAKKIIGFAEKYSLENGLNNIINNLQGHEQ